MAWRIFSDNRPDNLSVIHKYYVLYRNVGTSVG